MMNPETQPDTFDVLAARTFDLLTQDQQILVTAESCTAGLIAATLSRVPGMSKCLAGALVVYQSESKVAWLGIPAAMIEQNDVVSREVAEAMALKALQMTPHATIAVSITGHLGPDAPASLDGVAWSGYADRQGRIEATRLSLSSHTGDREDPDNVLRSTEPEGLVSLRHARQQNAVFQVLELLCDRLSEIA